MEDNRKRYKCECPVCKLEFWACKSIFQSAFGMPDMGSGKCPGCNTFLKLTVDEENERMIAAPWDRDKVRYTGECK
jgi:hypothetical protein